MQRAAAYARSIAILVLCFATLSCASDSVELNSERIARKHGNYGIDVIENKENTRVSNLYSLEAGRRICRTFAVVGLSDEIDPSFAAEHVRIVDGGSIGAVFKRNGWSIEKRHLYIGEIPIGQQAVRLTRLMRIKTPATLAVHLYVLEISKGGNSFEYAMIAEVYHPDYLSLPVLWSMYGSEYSGDKNRKDARQILEHVRKKFRESTYSG